MQHVEFQCKGCGVRYRVSVALAGRVAECRHCGQKMVVPYKSPIIKLGDDHAIGFAEPDAPAQTKPTLLSEADVDDESPNLADFPMETEDRTTRNAADNDEDTSSDDAALDEFDLKDDAPEYHAPRRIRKTSLVPELFAELVLPVLLMVISFGWAGTVVVQKILASQNVTIGFILLALAASGLLLIVIPLTLRGIEGSAKSLEFELSNAVWLQTAGLIAVPTSAITLGWFYEGRSGAVTWGLLGLALMGALMVLIYRAGIGKSLMATLLAGLCYVFGSGMTVGGIALLCFILFKTGFTLPWHTESATREVAKAAEPAAPRVETPAPPPPTPTAPIEAPKIVEAPKVAEAPVAAPKPVFVWDGPAVDPAPQPAGAKWPADVHHLIDVKPPITLAQSSPGSPFIAMVDSLALHVYDLRTGKRCGFIKEQVPPLDGANGLLSPDGSTLVVSFAINNPQIGMRAARNRGAGAVGRAGVGANFAPPPGSPELAIWSIPESRLSRHIPVEAGRAMPQVLGFTKSNAIVLIALNTQTSSSVAQIWDAKSASLAREFDIALGSVPASNVALSAGGKFLGVIHSGRLSVFDVDRGTRTGDIELPHGMNAAPRAMSFSRDGSQLAIIANDANALQLLTIDMTNGKVVTDAPLAGGARKDLCSDDLMWVPRGGGMLIGSDWIDCATGKITATLEPQSAGNSSGHVRTMLSDYHVLVEFLPAGSGTGIAAGVQRVIYKTVMLPKRDIDAALASRKTSPSVDSHATAVAPTAVAPTAVAPTTVAPTTVAPTTGPSEASAIAVEVDAADQDGKKRVPTTAPTGTPQDLVRDAVAHLAYGRNQDALTTALAVLKQFPKTGKPASDEHAVALHVAAVAYMRLGEFQKARGPMDLAAAYSKTSRALAINRAKLDIMNQGLLIRAGKELDRVLAISLDEDTLNLFGVAISKAMMNTAMVGQAKSLAERYEIYNKKLESTRPGMRHWGTRWMSQAEYNSTVNPPALVAERNRAEQKAKLDVAEVERTRKLLADAKHQAFFDQTKRNIDRDSRRGNQPMYVTRAEDAFNAAVRAAEASTTNLEAIRARFPVATWVENLEPTLPELELTPRAK